MTKNNIKDLSIQINLSGLSFCILNRTSNTIEYLHAVDFGQRLNPNTLLNKLKEELSNNMVFSEDFDAVLIIHQNELSTLVPKDLYQDSLKADYLKFNSKILKTDFITEDIIAINNSVNVYVPYVNINNYIFDTFGAFVYKHASTLLIDGLLQQLTRSEDTTIHIDVTKSSMAIAIAENNQLQLVNTFDYHTKEDFIYYVLFVFEQLKINVETCQVKLSGNIAKDDQLYSILYTYIRHIEIINSSYNFEIASHIPKTNLHHHYLILNSF